MQRILTTQRDWNKLLKKHKNNSWLHKLYILSLIADQQDNRKQA